MERKLKASLILIGSTKDKKSSSGTGFVVWQAKDVTYVLTCAHVVDEAGGEDCVKVQGESVIVHCKGERDQDDLAVLRIGRRLEKEALPLADFVTNGAAFVAVGYPSPGRGKKVVPESITGKVVEDIQLPSVHTASEAPAWKLQVEGELPLDGKGMSGSPIMDKESGYVFGVISDLSGTGGRGLAISVVCLRNLWKDMPQELIQGSNIDNNVFLTAETHLEVSFTRPNPKELLEYLMTKKMHDLGVWFAHYGDPIETINQDIRTWHNRIDSFGIRHSVVIRHAHDAFNELANNVFAVRELMESSYLNDTFPLKSYEARDLGTTILRVRELSLKAAKLFAQLQRQPDSHKLKSQIRGVLNTLQPLVNEIWEWLSQTMIWLNSQDQKTKR